MTVWSPNSITLPGSVDIIAIQWGPGAKNGDTFTPIVSGSLVDHSIQVEGTFGVGTSVTLQGSNDAISTTTGNYHALTDPYGTTVAITSASIKQTTEVTAWVRPAITQGDGSENLTITVSVRRSYR
jgi:hypothetical protein